MFFCLLSSPLFRSDTLCGVLCFLFSRPPCLYVYFLSWPILCSPLIPLPPFFLPPTWLPSLASLAGSHTFPLLLKNGKWRQIVPNNVLSTATSISEQSGTEKEQGENGMCAFSTRQPTQRGTFNRGTLFLQLFSLLYVTIFWWSRQFSCLFGEVSWKWFLLRNAVSCIHLSVCFSRASTRQAATALHIASAKCNLLKPRCEGWGGELNDYNAPGMWAIHPQ